VTISSTSTPTFGECMLPHFEKGVALRGVNS
jgi:hypothetical protein